MSYADRSTIFFDLDGTLTDPAPGITRSLAHALAELGAEVPSLRALERFIGPPLQQTFAELLDTRDRAVIDDAVRVYRERYGEAGLYECVLMPGIEALLARLAMQERELFVVTAKPTLYAERVVEHFGIASCFEGVHGPGLDGTRADKAELIAHVLREEGLEARSTVMVGDREQDMLGAVANGVSAIGVLWGYGSEAELMRSGAAALAESAEVLSGMLGGEG